MFASNENGCMCVSICVCVCVFASQIETGWVTKNQITMVALLNGLSTHVEIKINYSKNASDLHNCVKWWK